MKELSKLHLDCFPFKCRTFSTQRTLTRMVANSAQRCDISPTKCIIQKFWCSPFYLFVSQNPYAHDTPVYCSSHVYDGLKTRRPSLDSEDARLKDYWNQNVSDIIALSRNNTYLVALLHCSTCTKTCPQP